MSIADNLKQITDNIATIARKCGRDPATIRLVAVSKKFPATVIEEATRAGHTLFGENYIQEAESKITVIDGGTSFHFIGHLQRNKAKLAARLFDMIETVDGLKLAATLNRHLIDLDKKLAILVQVNVAGEQQKSGVSPEQLGTLLDELKSLENLEVHGLMTMPPLTDSAESVRPYFRSLRQLADIYNTKGLFYDPHKVELSMGMSGDYPVAIEEGATIIRIGTAIFGQRQY